MIAPERLDELLAQARAELLARRNAAGVWRGRLSSSALSTATALSALSLAGEAADEPLRQGAVAWLAADQNEDGGWGDTPDSPSNLSTTLLCVSALRLAEKREPAPSTTVGEPSHGAFGQPAAERALQYVAREAGNGPEAIAAALARRYGADRTFAVPILMNCALAGLVPWRLVPELPCEMAAVPQSWYRLLRLQVVSYALPALIAVGLVVDHHRPGWRRPLRHALRPLLLRKLAALQPENGGFLEATPLTAFTAMSLLGAGGADEPVVQRCLSFLRQSVRDDGSWPIDTDLATWVTSSAGNALLVSEGAGLDLGALCDWVSARQLRHVHPYTGAAPGGHAWTDLPGAVPDADDTAGALLLLATARRRGVAVPEEAVAGAVRWLLDLQNSDGGWPTFCRGWGKLPFDQSAPDLTAHVLRALAAAGKRETAAWRRGLHYLRRTQAADGAWRPLWFGNQAAPEQANPVLGTARVVLALLLAPEAADMLRRALDYLVSAQDAGGGWGGAPGVAPSIEETALAVGALAEAQAAQPPPELENPLARGGNYLLDRVADGTWTTARPIGLYFASLWYAEELYPLVWTVEALGRLRHAVALRPASAATAGEGSDTDLAARVPHGGPGEPGPS